MDPQSIKRWCVLNIIVPGLSLIDNNTTRQPTCHLPGPPGPTDPEFWFGSLCGVIVLTLIIVITVGAVLAIYLHRRRAMMRRMFGKGLISKEEYERLK